MLDKKDLKYILILFFLTLIFFYKPLTNLNGIFYPSMDLVQEHHFWKHFTVNSFFKFHELPLWDPYVFGGVSFISNPSISLFYPLNFLFFIMPINIAFTIISLIQVFLAGFFMYLFLKKLKIDHFPSFIDSLVFAFSGMLIVKINHGNLNQLLIVSLIPLLFLSAELLFTKRKFIYSILMAVSITLMFLANHTQLFYYICITILLYILLKIIFNIKKENLKKISSLVLKVFAGFLLGILLSFVVLIPMLEFTYYSNRSGVSREGFESSFAMSIKHSITMLLPYFYGSEIGFPTKNTFWGEYSNGSVYLYIGIIPLFMALMALIFYNKKEKWIFLILSVFIFLIMLGKNTFFYPLLFKFIPGFNLFRAPQKAYSIFVFFIIVLASYGLNWFTKEMNKKTKRIYKIINKALVIGLVLAVIITGLFALNKEKIVEKGKQIIVKNYENSEKSHPVEYYLDRPTIIYNQILVNLIVFCFMLSTLIIINYMKLKEHNIKWIKLLLFIIILADLFYVSLPLLLETGDYKGIFEKNNVVKFLEKDKSMFRVLDQTEALNQEIAEIYNIQSISGYDALIPREYSEFTNLVSTNKLEVDPDLHHIKLQFENPNNFKYDIPLNLLNVKYIILKEKVNLSYLNLVRTTTFYDKRHDLSYVVYIYENNNVLPRAFIVPNAKVIKDKERIFDEIRKLDAKNEIVVEKEVKGLKNPGEFKEADIVYYSPNKIIVNVSIQNSGFLVLSENYYSGWKAYDNNKRVEILKADYVLRAVYLEKGNHIVEFRYDPLSYKIGKIVTLLTILSIIIYLVFYFVK